MKEIIKSIDLFEKELAANNKVKVNHFDFVKEASDVKQIAGSDAGKIEKTVLDFYGVSAGLSIDWEPVDDSLREQEIVGRIKILPFPEVFRSWKGVVYFNNEPENSPRRWFYPVDFFIDEAAAGFCVLEGYQDMIYLSKFEGDIIPLHINFSGYLRLMLLAKGCIYWHYLLLNLITGEENEVNDRITGFLPKVFPDFSITAFEGLFNQLRIN